MGELTLIYTTKGGVPKEGCHLSHTYYMCQIRSQQREGRHFFTLGAATSRGRHLSKRGAPLYAHVLKSLKIWDQSNANHFYLVPFDSLLTFAINFSPNLSPFIFFIFDLADFY
jgi:hypothetical protein